MCVSGGGGGGGFQKEQLQGIAKTFVGLKCAIGDLFWVGKTSFGSNDFVN